MTNPKILTTKFNQILRATFVSNVMKAMPKPAGLNDREVVQAIETKVIKALPDDVKLFSSKYPGSLATTTAEICTPDADKPGKLTGIRWYTDLVSDLRPEGAIRDEYALLLGMTFPQYSLHFVHQANVPKLAIDEGIFTSVVITYLPDLSAEFVRYVEGVKARAAHREQLCSLACGCTTFEQLQERAPELARFLPPVPGRAMPLTTPMTDLINSLQAAGLKLD